MSPGVMGGLGILVFTIIALLRVPIPFAFLLIGFGGISLIASPGVALNLIAKDTYSFFSSYSFSTIPMYILMGYIAFYSGIGRKLFLAAEKMVGHRPGGLTLASQAASAMFGAICGSLIATITTIGSIALPEMRQRKYDIPFSSAAIAAAAPLGILIPPSTPLLAFSAVTGESVGKLFIAGIVPGIILMIVYMIITSIIVTRKPELGPPSSRSGFREVLAALMGGGWETLLIFIISIGGLFTGWFTPTEAGAVGAGSLLLVTILNGSLTWEGFKNTMADTTRTTALVMMLLATAMFFGRFLVMSNIPIAVGDWVGSMNVHPWVVILTFYLIYIIAGCFIDSLPLSLMTIPIFLPVVQSLGYSAIWFGVAQVILGSIGILTPPVGMGVFVIKGIAGKDVSLESIFKHIGPFLVALLIVSVLVMIFPSIITSLPQYMTY